MPQGDSRLYPLLLADLVGAQADNKPLLDYAHFTPGPGHYHPPLRRDCYRVLFLHTTAREDTTDLNTEQARIAIDTLHAVFDANPPIHFRAAILSRYRAQVNKI